MLFVVASSDSVARAYILFLQHRQGNKNVPCVSFSYVGSYVSSGRYTRELLCFPKGSFKALSHSHPRTFREPTVNEASVLQCVLTKRA